MVTICLQRKIHINKGAIENTKNTFGITVHITHNLSAQRAHVKILACVRINKKKYQWLKYGKKISQTSLISWTLFVSDFQLEKQIKANNGIIK